MRSSSARTSVGLGSGGATHSDGELDVRVLGPLAVARNGVELALGGRRQRLVLALLISEVGCPVPAERLVEEIWGAARPATGTGPLRTYIWGLRRLLGQGTAARPGGRGDAAGVLVSCDAGYLLDIDRDRIDLVRFEALLEDAQATAASGHPERALIGLEDALGLWRGPVFGDLAGEAALQPEARRIDQLLLAAKELRAQLMVATGQEAAVVVELDALANAHPERERLWAMLMTALWRSGRQADALRCFQDARARLTEKVGLEPGPELRVLEQAILRQDPDLDRLGGFGPLLADHHGVHISSAGGRDGELDGASTAPGPVEHNLPQCLTSLVGRTAERVEVAQLLGSARLVTLSGSGGCGKTRLALAVAEDVLPRFRGGVRFVDLSGITDPDLVPGAVAEVFGGEPGWTEPTDNARRAVSNTSADVLLVLDNCEHLAEAVAELAEKLLTSDGTLRILATSREELGLDAESVWRVLGLDLPARHLDDPARLLDSEAVQLFVERGRSVLANFAPRGDALSAVAQVCRRLDGIPLAIELAAALVGSVPVVDIAARLDDRLRLLTVGRHSNLPRHQTLRATFDWSFDLLDERAQRLFAKLGVFVGSFDLPAAQAVTGSASDRLAVVRALGHLVRTSMVDCLSDRDGARRYRLQKAVRQYANERLAQIDDADEVRHRHARYYADFIAAAERRVYGPAASRWLRLGRLEFPNQRAALAWAFSHNDIQVGLRLVGALHWFLIPMGLLEAASRWLDAALERRAELPPDLELKAVIAACDVALTRGELSRACRLGDKGIALARGLDDAHPLAVALMLRGAAAVWAGELARAEECFVEADELCRRLGNHWSRAWMLTSWATASHFAGHIERAQEQIDEALEIFGTWRDIHGQVLARNHLALFRLEEGRGDEARRLAREALRMTAVGNRCDWQHGSLGMLGVTELLSGRLHLARDLLVRSLGGLPDSPNWVILTRTLDGVARLSMLAGRHSHGAALFGMARQLRERWGICPSAVWAGWLDGWLASLEAELGTDQLELALSRGRAMDIDEAVRLAETATASFTTLDQRLVSSGPGGRVLVAEDRA